MLRVILVTLLASLLGALVFCLLAFGSLYLLGYQYSASQIATAAIIFASGVAIWAVLFLRSQKAAGAE